jgi:membrane associated rhomboid family serine protease
LFLAIVIVCIIFGSSMSSDYEINGTKSSKLKDSDTSYAIMYISLIAIGTISAILFCITMHFSFKANNLCLDPKYDTGGFMDIVMNDEEEKPSIIWGKVNSSVFSKRK